MSGSDKTRLGLVELAKTPSDVSDSQKTPKDINGPPKNTPERGGVFYCKSKPTHGGDIMSRPLLNENRTDT